MEHSYETLRNYYLSSIGLFEEKVARAVEEESCTVELWTRCLNSAKQQFAELEATQ